MDRLEEFIRKNRDDLNRYNPSPQIWRRIKSELKQGKLPVTHWISFAAMVIVILGSALVLIRHGKFSSDGSPTISNDELFSPANTQLKEIETYYNNMVNSLYHEAGPLFTGNPELEKELNADISQIDSIYSEIKKDLKDNIANQDVVEALIQNYKIKIRLLEDMLIILEKKGNENKREKIKIHEL
jgi:hypothetical protein